MRYTKEGWRLLTWLRGRLFELQEQSEGHTPDNSGVRLVFVQYGDFSEAYHRLREQAGEETYYAQRYTIDYVAELAAGGSVEAVTVVTFSRDEALTQLAPRLFTAGVKLYDDTGTRHDDLIRVVEQRHPTHLIISAPIVPLMRWGLSKELPVLPLFADSFRGQGLRQQVRNARLAYVLNDPRIRYVANHNLAAALDLERIGVEPSKILPYDWPAVDSPREHTPKSAPPADRPFRLIYVGQVSEAKGVGDLIRALVELNAAHKPCTLTVIGQVVEESLPALATELGVADQVNFMGTQAHDEVAAAMREHDVVVVPSRHEYPEGLPMTLYEGLCSRTPLIVSDHPMFALRIRSGENALVFQAGSPVELAASVLSLASDAALYERLSHNAESAADGYLCPLKWDRLITSWLDPAHGEDIDQHRLDEALAAGPSSPAVEKRLPDASV
jgi:glycosyltransferase involved in cell wall biosynthesis